ncbi:leucine-rich repeat-containing protein 59-like [Vespula squamosa]|uniref:Leucine-rich repeat-containing protein 59-like n=1 Tax=Vespula squamosa TaxID=30214 RepID=A0ABD1ZZN0_VESSQ
MKLKNIGNRIKDDNLDLSLCDLEEVPVEEIATIRKLTYLDLSNNFLVTLPNNFVILKQILKLDLSKNMLTEIPENFGEMTQLRYLDLYANQISRLPLSLSELKNLRWLDLKENPLTPSVASIAGPCNNAEECKNCARNVVEYLNNVKCSIEEEKLRRLNAMSNKMSVLANKDNDNGTIKKESKKKKKKKHTEREVEKNLNKNKSEVECKVSKNIEDKMNNSKEIFNEQNQKHCISTGNIMYNTYFTNPMDSIFPKTYQRYGTKLLQNKSQILMKWINHAYKTINDIYNGYNLTNII